MTGYYTLCGAAKAISEAEDCIWALVNSYSKSFSDADVVVLKDIYEHLASIEKLIYSIEVEEDE